MSADGPRPHVGFPTTHWSLVAMAAGEDAAGPRRGLSQLVVRYTPALLAHLVTCRRLPPERADDLLQGFLTDKAVEGRLLRWADRTRGKFRTFLLAALDNYVRDVLRRERAARRVPVNGSILPLEAAADEPTPEAQSSSVFDQTWAKVALYETLRQMRAECEEGGRSDTWGIFEARLLRPTLDGGKPVPYEEVVLRFGFQSPVQAFNALTTAKRMFARLLERVIREYELSDGGIADEIANLRDVLLRSGA